MHLNKSNQEMRHPWHFQSGHIVRHGAIFTDELCADLLILLQYCEEVFKNPEAKRRHTGLVHFPEKHKCTICLRSCYSAFRYRA